jgi:hypothetical protein
MDLKFKRQDFQDKFKDFDSISSGSTGDISDVVADLAAFIAQKIYDDFVNNSPVIYGELQDDTSDGSETIWMSLQNPMDTHKAHLVKIENL